MDPEAKVSEVTVASKAADQLIAELEAARQKIGLGGGPQAIEKQHQAGKLTARERLEVLLDPGSFVELDAFVLHRATDFEMDKRKAPGDGVVAGFGKIDGRPVCVYAQDFTVMGGSIGETHAQKINAAIDLALKMGAPVIGLNDSGGARIQEGVASLHAIGEMFARNVAASGVVPQIVAIMGPCAGGAVYSPALMDFIFMVEKTSYMFITGPRVVKTVTGEEVSNEDLGGPRAQAALSGVAHFISEDDKSLLQSIRTLIGYLPSNSLEDPPTVESADDPERVDKSLDEIVPVDTSKGYDIRSLIDRIFDLNSFFEVQALFAPNAVVGFARLAGQTVGIVANQPKVLAGTLDIDSADKIARFVRFCDCFNTPLITFVDVPGYMPGTKQEHGGIIRHGAKILHAYAEATVPKISVVVRKAYGGAYIAMCSKSLGADFVFAYPTAEIAVMGPEGAVEIVYRKELEAAPPESKAELSSQLEREYRSKFANPWVAASRGYINSVIAPSETRPALVKTLRFLSSGKRPLTAKLPRKHGNIPL